MARAEIKGNLLEDHPIGILVAHQDARIKELEAEVAIARERLGPAGYKILSRVKELEEALNIAAKALEHLADRGIMRARHALTKLKKHCPDRTHRS